ncbi:MAG: hypothetical protein JW893_01465 [Candidatus Omnitrophica bacterium]|nr:hypothetical protein [Candidatus Omnitrophota bacterium]
MDKKYDAYILSDYSRKDLTRKAEQKIAVAVKRGSGLLMVGGWGSFSGPYGGWKKSVIEKILPVQCLDRDDRIQFSGGAYLNKEQDHNILGGLSFKNPPVIIGLNDVKVRKNAQVVLSAKKIVNVGGKLLLDPISHPVLILSSGGQSRVAALTTDLAPHWCGGLLDWGTNRQKLPASRYDSIEVGDQYIQFVTSLIRWLVGN